ncbi:uncharacterized protein LOC133199192 [Saccostrea echinata]|uniref:uncharacterized protein LOC133199192 n=1 Tax=Saccostrea echinata TaxID=191078 RepID=UPI002A81E860|nr:uncharacterized protein LOC133199192 [Saccostrea echinata]
MPPKRISRKSRTVPTPASQQNKRRRVSTNMEAVATATPLSPDVLETFTRQVTERVTATIREELTTLISNATSSTTATSQGSISNDTSVASVNNDPSLTNSVICGSESTAPSTPNDQAIQQSVEALVINHTEKIAGKSVLTTGAMGQQIPSQRASTSKISELTSDIQRLLDSSLTSSSTASYSHAWTVFQNFAKKYGFLVELPVKQHIFQVAKTIVQFNASKVT